jgi:hypothetical protein
MSGTRRRADRLDESLVERANSTSVREARWSNDARSAAMPI